MIMKLNYKAVCSSCRKGEINAPADAYVTGYDQINQRPFRGYLCDDHLEVVLSDGQLVNENVYTISIDAISKAEFGYGFAEFVKKHTYPTLRGNRLSMLADAFNAHMKQHKQPYRAIKY
jgi:hypothetical protein